MSDVKHTAEPWRVVRGEITYRSDDDDQSFGMNCPVDIVDDANARRIVACVNALQGVPTEFLEKAVQMGITDVSQGNLFSSRVELRSQRDQLLEALEKMVQVTKHLQPCQGTLDRAIQAIASVKGEK